MKILDSLLGKSLDLNQREPGSNPTRPDNAKCHYIIARIELINSSCFRGRMAKVGTVTDVSVCPHHKV